MTRRFAWVFWLLPVAGLLALLVPAGTARAQVGGLSPGPASFAPLVRLVAPSVVGIAVIEAGSPARDREVPGRRAGPVAQAAGSGFIITPNGAIVTNDHVIEGAASIVVTLNDGQRFPAHLVGTDALTDLAVIGISPDQRLTPARWGDSAAVSVGDWVLVAGNPFALGNSFTAGIVSAEGRDIGDGPFDHFLQLDAPINPGNSGGPAFNMAGQVVGVNTAIVSPSGGSVGIGFAIPSDTARKIVASLLAHGAVARGWLGVSVADQPDGGAGAQITGLQAGGPADRAGLAPGDIVVAVDGEPVADSAALIRAIASLRPGCKVMLGITRNGHILTLPVVIDRRPSQSGE